MMVVQRSRRVVETDGTAFRLTPTEYSMLVALGGLGKGQLITRELLIQVTWGHTNLVPRDAINLKDLLRKLKKKVGVNFIQARRGYGYMLTEEIHFTD